MTQAYMHVEVREEEWNSARGQSIPTTTIRTPHTHINMSSTNGTLQAGLRVLIIGGIILKRSGGKMTYLYVCDDCNPWFMTTFDVITTITCHQCFFFVMFNGKEFDSKHHLEKENQTRVRIFSSKVKLNKRKHVTRQ